VHAARHFARLRWATCRTARASLMRPSQLISMLCGREASSWRYQLVAVAVTMAILLPAVACGGGIRHELGDGWIKEFVPATFPADDQGHHRLLYQTAAGAIVQVDDLVATVVKLPGPCVLYERLAKPAGLYAACGGRMPMFIASDPLSPSPREGHWAVTSEGLCGLSWDPPRDAGQWRGRLLLIPQITRLAEAQPPFKTHWVAPADPSTPGGLEAGECHIPVPSN
jgi:hypothetical protein